jgi:hypothetical protein
MGSMQRNVEFWYQLSICSGTKENLDGVGGSQDLQDEKLSSSQQSGIKYESSNISPYLCCCFLFFFFSTSCFLTIIFMCI